MLLKDFEIFKQKYVDYCKTKSDVFTFGLAPFKLENGKTGFIDKDGKKYYD